MIKNTRSQAAKKAWETRRANAKKASKKATTKKLVEKAKPRVVVFDIPKGAKRVTVLPGYETVKFS